MIDPIEVLCTLALFAWVIVVVHPISLSLYNAMVKRGVKREKAVYYIRKVIHIAAGGFVALLVPFLYNTPLLPSTLAIVLAILTYIPHRRGKLMYWFQVEDNIYEVHFCIMWGIVIALAWLLFGMNRDAYWYGVIPVAFMAFGDGVTGLVRNKLYGHRTKSWKGNIAMLLVTIPIGALIGLAGIIAAFVASIIEHFEIPGIIDDNITVPLASFIVIIVLNHIPLPM